MSKIKVAVIGVGHLGRIHTMLWKKHKEIELVGVYDNDIERAKLIAEEFGVSLFKSLNDIIGQVEAVTISSSTISHYEIASYFLKNNIHCFIEKPITANYYDALELINIAKERDLIVQVGHVERFNPAIAALSNMEISPLFIEAHRLSQFRPRAVDVSVVHDLMIHDIDIVLSLVKSKLSKLDANGVAVLTNTPDICNARLSFENGAVANLTASRISSNQMRKMRVFQKDAYISIDFGKPDVDIFKLYEDGEEPKDYNPTTKLGSIESGVKNKNIYFEKPEIPVLNAIEEEHKAFIDSIKNGLDIKVTAEDASEALRIAEEISNLIM